MEKPYVVGIDIGGTNTVFGVVDARGTILYSGSIKTGKYADVNDYVAELAKGLKSVIDQAGGPDSRVGHVHADFDDRRGHEHIQRLALER